MGGASAQHTVNVQQPLHERGPRCITSQLVPCQALQAGWGLCKRLIDDEEGCLQLRAGGILHRHVQRDHLVNRAAVPPRVQDETV